MLKFLLAAAPYLLKAPSATSTKQMARSFTALVLFALSGMAFTAAAFIYVSSLYGPAVGFLCVSLMFLVMGCIFYFVTKRPKSAVSNVPSTAKTDPIASMVPDSVMKDPVVSRLMTQISENPVATSVAAAAIGMLITREFMGD